MQGLSLVVGPSPPPAPPLKGDWVLHKKEQPRMLARLLD